MHRAAFVSRHTRQTRWPLGCSFSASHQNICLLFVSRHRKYWHQLPYPPLYQNYTSCSFEEFRSSRAIMSLNSSGCHYLVSKAMCELPQGLHDSLSVFIFLIKASDEEACSIITANPTATLCEIRVASATAKLNMSQRGVNIPLLYICNLVWCVCHSALPVKAEIIHRDWMGRGLRRASPAVFPCHIISQRAGATFCLGVSVSFWH